MKNKYTVTIGIAAYNEENNIGSLLNSIVKQQSKKYNLNKVIVISDGSTDNTAKIVKNYSQKNKIVQLIDDGKRKGKSARVNYLFTINKSDILICIDADVLILNNTIFDAIVDCFIQNSHASLVGGNNVPYKAKTFLGSIINTWIHYWQYSRRPLNNWDNALNCAGILYALKKNLAQKLKIPAGVTVDEGFVFYKSKSLGYTFKFCPKAVVYFKAPNNLSDFLKQSYRFGKTGSELATYFKLKDNKHSHMTKLQELFTYITFFLQSPVRFPLAILLQVYVKVYSLHRNERYANGIWDQIKSSK